MKAPWYPPGLQWDAPLERCTVPALLQRAAERWPDRCAIRFEGRRIAFGDLLDASRRCATGLQQRGVGLGVRVGLLLPNTPHYPIALFGTLLAGAVVVNCSPLDAPKAIEHKLADSRCDVLITLDALPQVAALAGGGLKTVIAGTPADYGDGSADSDWTRLLAADAGAFAPVPLAPDDLALLQYTGGTTGTPKGAMLTHANLSVAVDQLWHTCRGDVPIVDEASERVLAVLPLFHIYALTVNLLFGIRVGAELVLLPRFDADAAIDALSRHRITVFPGVPTMFTAIANHPRAATADLSTLKFCGSGGAPLPGALIDAFVRRTGCPLLEGWGMTETAASGTFTPASGGRAGSCGIARPGVELKLLDLGDPARDAAPGAAGELAIRGPNVMAGYWSRPHENAAAFTADGFFRSGDVATIDRDGWVFIVDRCKDMLLVGGFNVYPRHIEEALMLHPAVAEVIVIGVADAYRGQAPKAFVVPKPGAEPPTLDALKAFLADKLGRHEMPQQLEIRAELPKTAVGKLSKQALHDEEARRVAARPPL